MKRFGIGLCVLALAVFFAAPAMADGITPYASMRLGTFWSSYDFNDDAHGYTLDDDDEDLNLDIARIARFGAKGQVGDIYGVVELGWEGCENKAGKDMTAGQRRPYYNRDVYGRLLYVKWDFGAGDLIVGQDYTPPTYPSAQQAPGVFDIQNGFIGTGCLWDRRWPQIKVKLDSGLYFAAVQTYDGLGPDGFWAEPGARDQYATVERGGDSDVTIPKLFAGYAYKQDGLFLELGAGYNTYDYNDEAVGGTFDDSIDSYIVFLKGACPMGPMDLKFAAHYGQNLHDFGILGRHTNGYARILPNGDIEDATCYGGFLQGAFKMGDMTPAIGVGYASDESDDTANDEADEKLGVFVQCKIPIAGSFWMVPEVTYWDGMDDAAGNEDTDELHIGILWQANF
ncbi:MAG: hypothetical protein SWE60_16790 [Thermodesulfobacteriota bacterium]|nr:hypothetical protein [Thermodesulfobacteriota bacterium]